MHLRLLYASVCKRPLKHDTDNARAHFDSLTTSIMPFAGFRSMFKPVQQTQLDRQTQFGRQRFLREQTPVTVCANRNPQLIQTESDFFSAAIRLKAAYSPRQLF